MQLRTLFLDFPRLLVLSIGLIAAAGLAAALTVPRLEDPRINNRNAIVITPFPGADAGRVEALVTKPLEDALRSEASIKHLTSTSRAGVSVISIELKDRITNGEPIWLLLRDKLSKAAPLLPQGAGAPDLDDERGYAYTLIAGLRWTGTAPVDYRIMKRFAEALQDRLRNVPGTDLVRVFGAPDERIDVTADLDTLAAAGLTLDRLAGALANADARNSAGNLDGEQDSVTVEVAGAFRDTDRIGRIPVQTDGAATLRLADVATIRRALQDPPELLAQLNGLPGIAIASRQLPDRRIDAWAADTRVVLDDFTRQLPAGLSLDIVFDQSRYTETRLNGLLGNLRIGLLIVVAVLLLSMGWRAALIVGLSLPLTSLMALASFKLYGVQIHQMSVTGIIVALGLMVDNAIVMTNGIRADLARGLSRSQAVGDNIGRFAVPLLTSTVTTIIAFMPIVLMPGAAGEFVGPLSLSVILSLISSYIIAMTIIPALAGLVLRRGARPAANTGRLGFLDHGLDLPWLTRLMGASIDASLHRPLVSVVAALCLPILGFVGAGTLKEQFFPPAERDQFYISVHTPEQDSIRSTAALAARIDAILHRTDGVTDSYWFTGGSAPSFYYNLMQNQDRNPSYAQALVRTDSAVRADALMRPLQDRLDAAFPGSQILVRKLEQGPPFDAPIEVRLYGPDLGQLRRLGDRIKQIMFRVPDITHVRTTLDAGEPKIVLHADEDQLRLAGLSPAALAGQLSAGLDGRQGGALLEATEQLPVRVRLPGDRRSQLEYLRTMTIMPGASVPAATDPAATDRRNADDTGPGIPLTALASLRVEPAITAIPRRDGERLQEIKGYLYGGVLPAAALADFRQRLKDSGLELPPGYRLEFGGENEKRGEAIGNLMSSVALLLIIMLATVVLSFNSFRLAGIVFLAGFQALGLGLLSLTLGQYPLGFVVIVGIMGLVGLAINASIIILAAIREHPQARTGDPLAIRQVVVGDTSRHIVSTTVTTVGGFLPLVLAQGQFWPPFAVAIAGGTALATIVSFYFTPAAYRLIVARRQAGGLVGRIAARLRPHRETSPDLPLAAE